MYCKLFNSVTDAIGQLMRLETENAINTLMDAQRIAENVFIEAKKEKRTKPPRRGKNRAHPTKQVNFKAEKKN